MEPLIWPVARLTTYIAEMFRVDYRLKDLWVEGEVSNFSRAASGHLYFTLKDADSQIACVMWKTAAARQSYIPRDGERVTAHGKIDVYGQRGVYQLYADAFRPAGMGELYRQYELLKARLQEEGLFDEANKRPLPDFVRRVGIVTSPAAAALQDVLNVLRRRFPLAEAVLSPAGVQGNSAPPEIVRAIERLNRYSAVDVILVVRGGGSLEDLWCFNDERVVRAVRASAIPVVSGVGHETDFSLCDFAADVRAPTPSAAAELVTPDGDAIRAAIIESGRAMRAVMVRAVEERALTLDALWRRLERESPRRAVLDGRERVENLAARLQSAAQRAIERRAAHLDTLGRALTGLDPDATLRRGYALVTRQDGVIVRAPGDVLAGERVRIRLAEGQIAAKVEGNEEDDHE